MTIRKYRVTDEEDYARTYDEDEIVSIRKGDLRAIMDVGTLSMDFASGFLDNEQVEALRNGAAILGIDPTWVTPANFVCQYKGHEWHRNEYRRQPTDDVPIRCTICGKEAVLGQFPGMVLDEEWERARTAEREKRYAEAQQIVRKQRIHTGNLLPPPNDIRVLLEGNR